MNRKINVSSVLVMENLSIESGSTCISYSSLTLSETSLKLQSHITGKGSQNERALSDSFGWLDSHGLSFFLCSSLNAKLVGMFQSKAVRLTSSVQKIMNGKWIPNSLFAWIQCSRGFLMFILSFGCDFKILLTIYHQFLL